MPTRGEQWNIYSLPQSHHLYRLGDKRKLMLSQLHRYPRLHGQHRPGDPPLTLNPLTSLIRIVRIVTDDGQ
jgi:hypothetical protein